MRKDIYSGNWNDIELTEIRNKQKVETGFPIFLLTTYRLENMEVIDQTVWFTRNAMEEYMNKVKDLNDFIVDSKLLFVKDVKNVSYTVE